MRPTDLVLMRLCIACIAVDIERKFILCNLCNRYQRLAFSVNPGKKIYS